MSTAYRATDACHLHDADTGKRDIILSAGPEVSGGNAWEDEQTGIRACKRKNGEYVVITENSGYRCKNNLLQSRRRNSLSAPGQSHVS